MAEKTLNDSVDRALHLMAAGKREEAKQATVDLAAEHGWEGISCALQSWVDTVSAFTKPGLYQKIQAGEDVPAALGFLNTGDAAVTSADEVPAHVAWAGRWILSRMLMDKEQCIALMEALPEDIGPHIHAVLYSCGTSLGQAGWGKTRNG